MWICAQLLNNCLQMWNRAYPVLPTECLLIIFIQEHDDIRSKCVHEKRDDMSKKLLRMIALLMLCICKIVRPWVFFTPSYADLFLQALLYSLAPGLHCSSLTAAHVCFEDKITNT